MIECIDGPRTVTARKDHQCNDCLGNIAAGERYVTSTLKYDDVYRWKQHKICADFTTTYHRELTDFSRFGDGFLLPIHELDEGDLDPIGEAARKAIMDNVTKPPKDTP